MANIIQKILDAFSLRKESRQIRAMRARGRERDEKDNAHKTQHEVQMEKNAAEASKLNHGESRA